MNGRGTAIAVGVAVALALGACGGSSTSSSERTSAGQPSGESASGNQSGSTENARAKRALAGVRASILHFGKAGTKAEAKAAAMPLSAYFLDREHEFWPAACSYLSAAMRSRMKQIGGRGGEGCGKGIEAATAGSSTRDGEATVVAIEGFRREGGRGFLIYTTEAGKTNAMLMVLEAGKWKLDGVNPTPLFSS